MNRRTAAWLAWALGALSLAMFVATVMLYFLTLSVQPPASWGTGGLSVVLIFLLPFLAFPLVGALIASRRPNNPIGWICLAVGIFWMLANLTSGYGTYGLLAKPGSVPFPALVGSLGEWMWAPALGLLAIYLILLFPDGRLPSRRWRPLAWLSGAVIVLVSVGSALTPGPMEDFPGIRNPFGLEAYPWIAEATQGITLLFPLCILASAISLVLRFIRSGGEEREQIKWLAFAALILGIGFSSFLIPGILVPEAPGGANPLWENLLEDAVTLSFVGVPVAVGIAILRYRLYEIDIIINRTLVYGSLTATLVTLYFGVIVVLQRMFVLLTGQQSTLAVVASTLLIAALFTPLRRAIQSFIDRRFYRRRYDARKTLEEFSVKLRDETDLNALSDELVGVVRETMQPAHVTFWLRPDTATKGEHPH
ncbi:MAG: hypothetical protein M3317_11790 [Actinomycetota bacterium]|nr:hypothetical protein [Actinomycetota bacterium]